VQQSCGSVIGARVVVAFVQQGADDEQLPCCHACCAAQEVTLDFFGCAVKASEFSQHLAAMELLSAQVKALQSELGGLHAPSMDEWPLMPPSLSALWGLSCTLRPPWVAQSTGCIEMSA
jgi:hypothetical protein